MRPSKTTRPILALGLSAALALAACGGDGDDAQPDAGDGAGATSTAPPATTAETTDTTGGDTGGSTGTDGDAPADSVAVGLQLVSVDIETADLDDDEDEFVVFCFGTEVQEIGNESGFLLQGFDPGTSVESTSARLVDTDDSCVEAGYESGTDVMSFTLGVTRNSVVTDINDEPNIADSIGLGGSEGTAGATSAPELVAGEADETRNQLTYRFDEQLTEDGGNFDAANFGYYTTDGDQVTGTGIVSVEEGDVIVAFDEANQVQDAARVFVNAAAVTDAEGNESLPGAQGDVTAAPDLVSVTPVDGTTSQFDFTFDEPVTDVNTGGFVVYSAEGDAYTSSMFDTEDAQTIRASFPEVQDFAEQLTAAAVLPDAATGNDPEGGSNTVALVPLPGATPGGGSAGPDLVSVTLEDDGQATFTFDELLDEDGEFDPSGFYLVTDAGDVEAATDFVEVDGARLVLTFDEDTVVSATLGSIRAGAVADEQGSTNPAGTIERS